MKKILIVVSKNIEAGGVEFYLCKVLERIDRKNLSIDILVPGRVISSYHGEHLKKIDCHMIELCIEKDGAPKYIALCRNLSKLLKEKKYDVVHINTGALTVEALSLMIAKHHKIRVKIAHSHGTTISSGRVKELCRDILRKSVANNADYCLACSKSAAVSLFGKDHMDQVVIANNGIEADNYIYSPSVREKIRRSFQWDGKYVIGCIGRIAAEKNHKYLIKIFREVIKINPDCILVLIGTGELESEVKEQAKSLGLLGSVQFLGVRNDVNELLQGIDVFVLTSIREALGIVNIEAQASGLHCVISDVIPQEVNITNLVDFMSIDDDPKNWANKILQYNNEYERKDTSEIIKNCGYDMSSTASIIEKIYTNSI